ncbi:hypothetical protein TorRG33x02_126110 [Trema orientale]|uniref:Uncharacterized protein n=1 Tax=Trema orientale TaxID=63057 RepID=A0A2P5F1A8_TREOI|nr:hypothetical protein TorRG33x02_126110 [Trema orientale]
MRAQSMGHRPASQTAVRIESMASQECSGYDSDARLERRWKRRCIANQCFTPSSRTNAPVVIEENRARERLELLKHPCFPSFMYKHGDYKDGVVDGRTEVLINVGDDDEDPQYNMFLNNLKKDGNSYALEVILGNGVSERINYDVEDLLPDERRLDAPKTVESFPVNQRTEGETTLRMVFDGEQTEIPNKEDRQSLRAFGHQLRNEERELPETLDDVPGERRKSCLAGRSTGGEHLDIASGGTNGGSSLRSGSEGNHFVEHKGDHEDENDDEEYCTLLKSSLGRTNGGSYIRPGSGGHEDEYCHDREYCRLLNIAPGGANGQSNAKPGLEDDHLVECGRKQKDNFDDTCNEYVTYLNHLVIDDEDTMRGMHDSPERPDEVVQSELGRICDQVDECDDVTQDYLRFLDTIEKDGEDAMYKVDEESDDDLEIAAMDKDPFIGGHFTPFESTKGPYIILDDRSDVEDPCTSQSQFRKGLMEILKRPYDSQQHKVLWEEVSRRRPKVKDINLRRETISCPLENSFSKSYLDQYSDFAEQIDLAKYDDHKSLNLLRGFFYWLKNLAHVGVFQPWKDPSCLEVLPQK